MKELTAVEHSQNLNTVSFGVLLNPVQEQFNDLLTQGSLNEVELFLDSVSDKKFIGSVDFSLLSNPTPDRIVELSDILLNTGTSFHVRSLILKDTKVFLTGKGARIIERFRGVDQMNLSSNKITDKILFAILPIIRDVKRLDISFNQITDDGANRLAIRMNRLEYLNIGYNDIGPEGASAIAQNLSHLTDLRIGFNHIGDKGAKAIATFLPNLLTLDIGLNNITNKGAAVLAASKLRLRALQISFNEIDMEIMDAISRNISSDVIRN